MAAKQLITNFKNFFGKYDLVPNDDPDTPNYKTILGPVPALSRWMIIGFDICNVEATGVVVDVAVYNASDQLTYSLLKSAPVPVGSTLQVIAKQKHILEEGDILKIQANIQNAAHVTGSYIDIYFLG
jgi:hypothetical protein